MQPIIPTGTKRANSEVTRYSQQIHHSFLPPKRLFRFPYHTNAFSKATSSKSGHNKSVKYNSAYAASHNKKFDNRVSPDVRMIKSGSGM
mmetsp:Transcript_32258/g.55045  ORF Transcript_32258/g.55045 Transcript_32258/m.55045 type:complete len:89 (+) Transcript_32258:173-439(+)